MSDNLKTLNKKIKKVNKRSEYLSWREYFMELANLTSRRSKDQILKLVHVLLIKKIL